MNSSNNSKIKILKQFISDKEVSISIKNRKFNLMNYQKVKYVFFGGCNVVLSWILYFVFYHYVIAKRYVDIFGLITISPHIFAFLLSFAITFFTGFFLNYYLVFRSEGFQFSMVNRLMRYFVANMGSVVLNYLLLKLFVERLHWYPTPSQILCTSIITIYSYLAQRKFTFSKSF